ncbi:YceI family protein [soil metagenome]
MATLEDLLGDPGNATVWTLDPQRSRISFHCRSFWGLLPVKGTFAEFSGHGQLTDGTASGRVDIAAASLDTGIKKRDHHLRSDDFFAVERFPDISLVVTAVLSNGGGGAELSSNLTVRGITHPIPLPSTVTVLDGDAVQISTRATVDRTRWDVSGNLMGMVMRPTTLVATGVFVKSR